MRSHPMRGSNTFYLSSLLMRLTCYRQCVAQPWHVRSSTDASSSGSYRQHYRARKCNKFIWKCKKLVVSCALSTYWDDDAFWFICSQFLQVFFFKSTGDVLDMSRLSEQMADGCFQALVPHMKLLRNSRQTKVGIRLTIHSDDVSLCDCWR